MRVGYLPYFLIQATLKDEYVVSGSGGECAFCEYFFGPTFTPWNECCYTYEDSTCNGKNKKVVKTSILVIVELRTDPLGSLTSFSFDGVADSIIDGIEDENGYVDGTCDCKYIWRPFTGIHGND